jgi:hypothetical protein
MHPIIIPLAKHFGTKIENRNCFENHIYDGKTIAMFGSKGGKPLVFSDHDLLHEIAHFAVAAPEQRDLPEYGVGNAYQAGEIYTPSVVDSKKIDPTFYEDSDFQCEDFGEEGQTQEAMVQFLCAKWGIHYNVSPVLSGEDPEKFPVSSTWESYLDYKLDWLSKNQPEYAWNALFRLEKMGLLSDFPI